MSEALERAVRVAMTNAWNTARFTKESDALTRAVEYAIAIIVPIHQSAVDKAVRDAVGAATGQKEIPL